MNVTTMLGSIFSPQELALIIAISAVIGLLIIANVVVFYFIIKHRERKLCTRQLQQKRDSLLDHLASITDDGSLAKGTTMFSGVGQSNVEDDDDLYVDIDDDDDDDDEDSDNEQLENDDLAQNAILAVADMSEFTRRKLGLVGEEYDDKSYYVRYKYGFDAKLRASTDEVKERYTMLVDELSAFKGVTIKTSFLGQRVYKGRKTLAQIVIRGKTLCIAFALNPYDYIGTKYAGLDKSDKKRYVKTPMLYKLTSLRRLDYARYLILQLAEANTLVTDANASPYPVDFAPLSLNEMFARKAVRIVVVGEANNAEQVADPEVMLVGDVNQQLGEQAQEDIAVETPDGTLIIDRSFTARIIQADDTVKARYSELKNRIMGYKGVHGKVSWKRETFSLGADNVAMIALRGKVIMLYLTMDAGTLDGSQYKVENLSDVAIRRNSPLLFRVKDDSYAEHAIQLIDKAFEQSGAEYVERKSQDYTLPFKSTDALVKRDLIKITLHRND